MILDRRPGSDHLGGRGLRGWGRGQKPTVSEYGHVAYQIKENDACSNMVANMSPADPLDSGGVGGGVRIQLFQNMVMLHKIIKLKKITHAAIW